MKLEQVLEKLGNIWKQFGRHCPRSLECKKREKVLNLQDSVIIAKLNPSHFNQLWSCFYDVIYTMGLTLFSVVISR